VELGVPDVLAINEKNREFAVWNVCDRALPIHKLGDLSPAFLIEVDVIVLEQEHRHLVPRLVVDIHILSFVLRLGVADTRKGECGNGEDKQQCPGDSKYIQVFQEPPLGASRNAP
jgi:hypothetical protein